MTIGRLPWMLSKKTTSTSVECLEGVNHIVNFNDLNTFGTMQISSRQGKFEPMRVDYSARSGGVIGISLIFFNMKVSLCVLIRTASSRRF